MSDFQQARQNFLQALASGGCFAETLAFIDQWYCYTPSAFRNGAVNNRADQNQGSGKILALAILLDLDYQQTLRCFGEHYRAVLATPESDDHRNLRQLLAAGRANVHFESFPLVPRGLPDHG